MSRERMDELERGLLQLHARKDMSAAQRDILLDAAGRVGWDDAIHIAAPWEPRSSLCGNWFRNLTTLDAPRPNGMEGCWTCLLAADWFDENVPKSEGGGGSSTPPRPPDGER